MDRKDKSVVYFFIILGFLMSLCWVSYIITKIKTQETCKELSKTTQEYKECIAEN